MTNAADPGQPLLTPYRMGDLNLANRVVMAPLTRCRATDADLAPTELHAEYYAQRASAGLIVTEGIWVSRDAIGWRDVPGLFTDAAGARLGGGDRRGAQARRRHLRAAVARRRGVTSRLLRRACAAWPVGDQPGDARTDADRAASRRSLRAP